MCPPFITGQGWKPCPEEKGIKTRWPAEMLVKATVGNLALKKKGLRRRSAPRWPAEMRWKPCPEEKGIKTLYLY